MQPQELSVVSTPRPLLDSDLSTVRVSQFHQRASTTYRQQPLSPAPNSKQMTVMASDQLVYLVPPCHAQTSETKIAPRSQRVMLAGCQISP